MERVSWIQNGSKFNRVEGNINNIESIPVGIYSINFNPMSGWSLELVQDKFTFPYKIYGLQTKFIDHVLKTFNNTKGNLGILLNGTKGTGKTVSAKILANNFNLPIINVRSFGDNNDELIKYIASFNFSCVLFFDEFEKTWSEKDCSILQIMDGVYNSQFRKIFLLTTNETTVNENLISRPSRIRYLKEFGNLEQEIVREYLNDTLQNKEYIEQIINFVDTLQISTIDILKTIVEDINIHGFEVFMQNKDFFNVKTANYYYQAQRMCIENRTKLNELNYTNIDNFIQDIKLFANLHSPQIYEYATPKEFNHAVREYQDKIQNKIKPITCNIQTIKSVKSLKINDEFGYYDSEFIVQINIEKKVIVTKDTDSEAYFFYYIEDPNQKPSLYNHYSNFNLVF